jgi:hypothetical protein
MSSKYEPYLETIIALRSQGKAWKTIAKTLQDAGLEKVRLNELHSYFFRHKKRQEKIRQEVEGLITSPTSQQPAEEPHSKKKQLDELPTEPAEKPKTKKIKFSPLKESVSEFTLYQPSEE